MVLSISVGFVKESKIIIKYISAIGKIEFSASLQIIVRVTNYNMSSKLATSLRNPKIKKPNGLRTKILNDRDNKKTLHLRHAPSKV